MIVLSFFFQLFTILSFQVKWFNDQITIRLNEPIGDKVNLPEAKLYQNGVLISNAIAYYQKDGVDRTFISTVNTKIVKNYTIYYLVYFPEYFIEEKHAITFSVIDDIAPEFSYLPEFSIPVGSKIPNLLEGVIVTDNYTESVNLRLEVDSSRIVTSVIGLYKVIYKAFDESNNYTIYESFVSVYDNIPPTIKQNKIVEINYGSIINWNDFFLVSDNYDKNVKLEVDDSLVNYLQVGIYQIDVYAIDSSNLRAAITTEIIIVDKEKPAIKLVSYIPIILVYETITEELLTSFIIDISDNYSKRENITLNITHDIDNMNLGEYYIYYELIDESLNKSETKLKIKIADTIKPTVLYESIILEVNSNLPYFLDYFAITDNFDDITDLTIKITNQVKIDVIGKYSLTLEVTDSSKNKTTINTSVLVVDTTKPLIVKNNDIVITDFQKRSFVNYFVITDNYDQTSELTISIDDSNVLYNVVGIYEITITAVDTSGNRQELISDVFIVDDQKPIIILKSKIVEIMLNSNNFNPYDYIYYVSDNYNLDLNIDDCVITNNLDTKKPGLYQIVFSLKDSSNNEEIVVLYVFVKEIIEVFYEDLIKKKGDKIDLLEGLSYVDNNYTIYTYPNKISNLAVGVHEITYVFVDEGGYETVFTRNVTIVEDQKIANIKAYIPVILIVLGALGTCLIIIFKQNK